MKKVLIFSMLNMWSMKQGSGAPSFFKTIEGYLKEGWSLTLIVPNSSEIPNSLVGNLNVIKFQILPNLFRNIPVIRILNRLLSVLYAEIKFYQIGKKILQNNCENTIIYAYEVHAVIPGKKLSKKYKIPLVTRFQGTILAPLKNTFVNRMLYYPHFSALKAEADVVIMTDDGTKGLQVLKKLKNPSKNIYFWKNGVDFDKREKNLNVTNLSLLKSELGILENDKVLITVSRLEKWKRVDRAIIALSSVIKKLPNCKLIVIGDGQEKNNLISLSKELNVSDHVNFLGAVPHEDIYEYLSLADIFLSLYDLSNLGNPLFEAMVCGKPIITLDVGSTSSTIENNKNGILLTLDMLHELPSKIINLLNNIEFSKSLGNEARIFAEKNLWNWDERVAEEIRVVNHLGDD